MKEKRIIWMDLLRMLAIISVIIVHYAYIPAYNSVIGNFDWHIGNIYYSLCRFCVPILVMISGALFLSREIEFNKLYKKIFRLLCAYLFWNIIYNIHTSNTIISRVIFLRNSHLWFVPMIICLYLLTPVLKKITEDKKILEYFLIIFLILGVAVPFLTNCIGYYKPIIKDFIGDFKPEMCGYIGYYLLGYHLYKYDSLKGNAKFYLGFYLISTITCIIGTYYLTIFASRIQTVFYDYFSITTLIQSASLFLFFKYNFSDKKIGDKTSNIIAKISYYTFGVYLIHILIMNLLTSYIIDVYFMSFIGSIPILSVMVFILSLFITYIISKIPIINKYII